MSEYDQDQKTEEATPKQRERFRDQGDVPRSQDLGSVVAIAAGAGAIALMFGFMSRAMTSFGKHVFGRLDLHERLGEVGVMGLETAVIVAGPVLIAGLVLGVAAQIAQVGWNPTLKPLAPNFGKLNPLPRFRTLFFSASTAIELLKSLAKIGVIGALSLRVLSQELSGNSRLVGLPPEQFMIRLGQVTARLVITVVIALAFIAVVDLLIERYRYNRKIKMTKEEVKREHKDSEGDPVVKGRIRNKQREMMRSRMLKNVPKADVVVVNPTHFSVALRYRMGKDPAPMIAAAGADAVAAKIREIARHHNIPIVSDPPLARALFAQGKIGKPIPKELFRAVASLLAWVYKVTGKVA
jgi:flagellar biosynthesis protein FlhB